MITVVNIETALWNRIASYLQEEGWKSLYRYNGMDAGIDYDLLHFKKGCEEILMGWYNWGEGEIQCSETTMKNLEAFAGTEFKKGEPNSLKPGVVKMYAGKGFRAPAE